MQIKRKVLKGLRLANKIGYPTANFWPYRLTIKKGVYLCKSIYRDKEVWGCLYYGPKFNLQNKPCLEVYFFNFNKNIYQKYFTIEILNFIRSPKKFKSLAGLKKQIYQDIQQAKSLIC